MDLYTDRNPQTTVSGLGFSNRQKAVKTIERVERYFDHAFDRQPIPGWTPEYVLPSRYLENRNQADRYYQQQKMYRILGMLNRAKGVVDRVDQKRQSNMRQAISIFERWMRDYHNSK